MSTNCCKYKITLGYGRLKAETLEADDTTVIESIADIDLDGGTIIAYHDSKEEFYFTPVHGEFFLLRYGAIASIVDPSGVAISGITTYALLKALILDLQAAEKYPGTSVNLQNVDPVTVDMTAQIDDLPLPASGYTGIAINCTVASSDLTGIVAPTTEAQKIIFIMNIGTAEVDLKHNDAGSVAANQFNLPDSTSEDIDFNGIAILWYDDSVSRWKLLTNI